MATFLLGRRCHRDCAGDRLVAAGDRPHQSGQLRRPVVLHRLRPSLSASPAVVRLAVLRGTFPCDLPDRRVLPARPAGRICGAAVRAGARVRHLALLVGAAGVREACRTGVVPVSDLEPAAAACDALGPDDLRVRSHGPGGDGRLAGVGRSEGPALPERLLLDGFRSVPRVHWYGGRNLSRRTGPQKSHVRAVALADSARCARDRGWSRDMLRARLSVLLHPPGTVRSNRNLHRHPLHSGGRR